MSQHGADDGSFVRDAGTQTVRAVVLIIVAVLVAVLLLHHTSSSSANPTSAVTTVPAPATTVPRSATTTTTVPATSTTTIPLSSVKVQVLNGASATQAIAGPFTTKLIGLGYATVTADNATSDVTTSSIYVLVAGFAPSADTLAATLGLPATST
jgi:hypothetical protein